MVEQERSPGKPAGPPLVEITVNEQTVPIHGPRVTGSEILEAAVRAGVSVQLDFVLTIEESNGKTRVIGPNDPVTVNKNSRFLAVAPDDNS